MSYRCYIAAFVAGIVCAASSTDDYGYIIRTTSLPVRSDGTLNYNRLPQVGNGHIAHVPFTDVVHMNGLFNGLADLSHRARIPAFIAFNFTISAFRLNRSHANITYNLNLDTGYFSQKVRIPKFFIDAELRIYANAHAQFACLLVYELTLTKLPGAPADMEFDINLQPLTTGVSNDVRFVQKDSYLNIIHVEGTTIIPESIGATPQTFYVFYTKPRSLVTFTSRDVSPLRFTFVQSVHYEESVARKVFHDAIEAPTTNYVFDQHQSQWREVWRKHRIEVPNNAEIDLLAQTSLYSLISSVPGDIVQKHAGIGTDGLGRSEGSGQTSWIQEAWILPVLNALQPKSARALLEYRKRQWSRLTSENKVSFPKLSGSGVTDLSNDCVHCTESNDCQLCKQSNDHVTAGIALAIKQYTSATNDLDLLRSGGYDVMADISRNFENRLNDQSEFVQLAGPSIMMYTYYSACLIGRHRILVIPERWRSHQNLHNRLKYGCTTEKTLSKDRRGLTDPRLDVPATILLFNWLPYTVKASRKLQILSEYEDSLRRQRAPSPGYSSLVSGWLDLGEEGKAAELMEIVMDYVRGPFQVWFDSDDQIKDGIADYLPGAAAYLQTLLFGYGGLRFNAGDMQLHPRVEGLGGALSLIGLNFVGSNYDVIVADGSVNLTLTRKGLVDTQYRLSSYDQWIDMKQGSSAVFPTQAFTIRSIQSSQVFECQTPDPLNLPSCMEESENTGYKSSANVSSISKCASVTLFVTLWLVIRSSWV